MPTTVTVWVNGAERTGGWGYDEDNNAIHFEAPLPAPGAEIVVHYTPLSPSAMH